MTGNVVFLGFAIAGAGGLLVGASLFAIAAFLAGSAGGAASVPAWAATGEAARRGHADAGRPATG